MRLIELHFLKGDGLVSPPSIRCAGCYHSYERTTNHNLLDGRTISSATSSSKALRGVTARHGHPVFSSYSNLFRRGEVWQIWRTSRGITNARSFDRQLSCRSYGAMK